MIEPYKKKSLLGAKKALGQLTKIITMIEDDKYCMDIAQQVRAVEGLLRSLSANILESHLKTCATKAFSAKNKAEKEKVIEEIVENFKRSTK